ncbi:ribbon-helix-helix domain-containing protein [Candidatus Bipolaricaulota bacterium]|nr:ribbon-helix-helix domain-containing protein [Candidatus Bipolaricaulota bacterium]
MSRVKKLITIEDKVYSEIKEYSEDTGIPISWIVEALIRAFLNEKGNANLIFRYDTKEFIELNVEV